ncbi:ubiquinone biosynthesis accessory factor UbiJ [Pseudidiomarina aestuarii]|uniref:ubiquinone biosynthesis accessory factor UbiJ n=1 Tax=Pseudidiomarina aestuarii TaxID=624146 RepID=UPI003A9727FE
MLWTVLPTSAAEALLNHILQLDAATPSRLAPLVGKRLRVTLKEFGAPLTVTVTSDGFNLSWVDSDPVECHIVTRLAVLPELRDSANITRLIKADALDIEGDPMLAQALSKAVTELDVDWPEVLSQRIGDVPAQMLLQFWQRSESWLQQFHADQKQWVRDAIIEEKQLAPSRTEFEMFRADVQQLRAQLDRLERSLKQLQWG